MKKGKRIPAIILAAALIVSSVSGNTYAKAEKGGNTGSKIQAEFFVSPDGSDENDGSYEKPFATLRRHGMLCEKLTTI